MDQPILSSKFGVAGFYKKFGKYYVTIPFKIDRTALKKLVKTNRYTGVDLNVGHFDTLDGSINVCPIRLTKLYQHVKYYQRLLAIKRNVNGKQHSRRSRNYHKIRVKLQHTYRKIHNIQTDLMQKFTTLLVNRYSKLVIEDLDVKKMQMSHIASKGLHRCMFGKFRQLLTYKCSWYGRQLILANRFYPSTQRCSYCGVVKTDQDKITLYGNKKHHTRHNEFVCYNPKCPMYNVVQSRDYNAVRSLSEIVNHPEINHKY